MAFDCIAAKTSASCTCVEAFRVPNAIGTSTSQATLFAHDVRLHAENVGVVCTCVKSVPVSAYLRLGQLERGSVKVTETLSKAL